MVSPEMPTIGAADSYLPRGKGGGAMNGFIWPSQGVMTSGYGQRWGRPHRGIDIAAPIGTTIVAAAPGVISYAGYNDGGFGYLVEVDHADGTMTRYAHNDRILVSVGQQVSQGEQISLMGSTGNSTGPHLHFEIHPGGQGAVNPMAYLPNNRG
jgi:murein DD-endopeptidase MepM/ murein hydrolase activator NlpD